MSDITKIEDSITKLASITAGITLPGEALVTAITTAIAKDRESMSQESRDKFDNLRYTVLVNLHNFWVDLLNKAGIPAEKVSKA